VLGNSNSVNATNAVAVGNGIGVTGANGVAIGNSSAVTGDNGTAIDLSPIYHPVMERIRASLEPWWLGDATGRGAEPST
jgi:hypothetical protein